MIDRLPKELQTEAAFAALFDHTLLKPDATSDQILKLCDEAVTWKFKGVCVNPHYVKKAADRLAGSGRITMAVVGFPLGANRSDLKADEAKRAIDDGARELDMVINVGAYLSGDKDFVRRDIDAVLQVAARTPGVDVKVIEETCFLTPDHITEISRWCVELGAAFVKTSTGFGSRGASVEDIAAMRRATDGSKTLIKASGGIRTFEAAVQMAAAGARRIGSSSTVSILEEFRRLR
jgi:deoxyribose-phosphate aldolase